MTDCTSAVNYSSRKGVRSTVVRGGKRRPDSVQRYHCDHGRGAVDKASGGPRTVSTIARHARRTDHNDRLIETEESG